MAPLEAAVAAHPFHERLRGHLALAAMEAKWGDKFAVITQNVDGLHQTAGSKTVDEIHGSLREISTRLAALERHGSEH